MTQAAGKSIPCDRSHDVNEVLGGSGLNDKPDVAPSSLTVDGVLDPL